MKKNLMKIVSLVLVLAISLTIYVPVFAATSETGAVVPSPYAPKARAINVSLEEQRSAAADGLRIVEKVTDPSTIQKMVNAGQVESENGKLPLSVTTYATIDKTDNLTADSEMSPLSSQAGITITKTNYYDGQYFDDYDRYQVDGPAQFSTTYSRSDNCNWNSSITGDVSVGGSIYGIADVKASVTNSVGYTFGSTVTKTQTYSINIPAAKYWVVKVWTSFLVYQYTAKVGSTTIATGKTWKPNGLIIQKTEYAQ